MIEISPLSFGVKHVVQNGEFRHMEVHLFYLIAKLGNGL
jgi:hypothetical protein